MDEFFLCAHTPKKSHTPEHAHRVSGSGGGGGGGGGGGATCRRRLGAVRSKTDGLAAAAVLIPLAVRTNTATVV